VFYCMNYKFSTLHFSKFRAVQKKKKQCKIHWRGSSQNFICLGLQETYIQECTHIYATELCKNQLQLAHGHESVFETACLPIIIAEVGGLILENSKESQKCGQKKLDFSHSNLLRELEMSLPLCFCFC